MTAFDRYHPLGRLPGSGYCRVADRFDIVHPPAEITPRK